MKNKNMIISGFLVMMLLLSFGMQISPVQAFTNVKNVHLHTATNSFFGIRLGSVKYYVTITTTYTWTGITACSLRLYGVHSGICPSYQRFFLLYNGGSYYWKIYSPTVYDNGVMVMVGGAQDTDSFSGITGSPQTVKLSYKWQAFSFIPVFIPLIMKELGYFHGPAPR